jgi:acetamidase/formamidase
MKSFVLTVVVALCASSMASAGEAGVIHLESTPSTVHRGLLSPTWKPVLTIKSGQTVEIDTISHSGLTEDPVQFFARAGIAANEVLPDAKAVYSMPRPDPPPPPVSVSVHVLTGPIYIDGAEPGDLLEVRILKVTPRVAYGVNTAADGGAAPGMLPPTPPGQPVGKIIKYDIAKKTVNFSPDIHFPVRPFMGIMAVAPSETVSSRAPGQFGGNMDFKRLQAGATLYLPVLVKGALFVTGDPHASQGDGEVSGNALESSMTPTLQFILHKGAGKELTMPYAEDAANYYVLGMDTNLDKALSNAIKETVKFLGRQYALSPADAYSLCSTAIDFSIAEAVDSNLTIYGTVPKTYFAKQTSYWAPRP